MIFYIQAQIQLKDSLVEFDFKINGASSIEAFSNSRNLLSYLFGFKKRHITISSSSRGNLETFYSEVLAIGSNFLGYLYMFDYGNNTKDKTYTRYGIGKKGIEFTEVLS